VLINDVLDASRASRGTLKLALKNEPIVLLDELAEAVELIYAQANPKRQLTQPRRRISTLYKQKL